MFQFVVWGQALPSDSSIRSAALSTIIKLYDQSLNEDSHLYNGPAYVNKFEDKILEGHPYYASDDWQEGFVFYDGQFYEKAYLMFNLFLNKLIIEHPTSHQEIELISEKIAYFGIGNVVFDRVQSPEPGFYARIYKGDAKVYAYYYKTIQEKNDSKIFITKFLDRRKLYIVKDDVFYPVNSKSSALKVFQDKKSELKKFLNEKNIQYHQDKVYALGKMAEYVDYLNSGK
jgi:hypothetical protein